MDLYNYLKSEKEKGKKLEWDSITYSELYMLFKEVTDGMIAELYGVKKSEVTKKRKEWDITQINIVFDEVMEHLIKNDKNKQ